MGVVADDGSTRAGRVGRRPRTRDGRGGRSQRRGPVVRTHGRSPASGRRRVMKDRTYHAKWDHEVAGNRFLAQQSAPRLHPACLDHCTQPPLIVFERLDGVAIDASLDGDDVSRSEELAAPFRTHSGSQSVTVVYLPVRDRPRGLPVRGRGPSDVGRGRPARRKLRNARPPRRPPPPWRPLWQRGWCW